MCRAARTQVWRDGLGAVDHREYIERHLSADIDGELDAEEQRAVAAHLANCYSCGQRRADAVELKRLLRERISIAAPEALRARILAALDAGKLAADVNQA